MADRASLRFLEAAPLSGGQGDACVAAASDTFARDEPAYGAVLAAVYGKYDRHFASRKASFTAPDATGPVGRKTPHVAAFERNDTRQSAAFALSDFSWALAPDEPAYRFDRSRLKRTAPAARRLQLTSSRLPPIEVRGDAHLGDWLRRPRVAPSPPVQTDTGLRSYGRSRSLPRGF